MRGREAAEQPLVQLKVTCHKSELPDRERWNQMSAKDLENISGEQSDAAKDGFGVVT
jgi:hypothetical protein